MHIFAFLATSLITIIDCKANIKELNLPINRKLSLIVWCILPSNLSFFAKSAIDPSVSTVKSKGIIVLDSFWCTIWSELLRNIVRLRNFWRRLILQWTKRKKVWTLWWLLRKLSWKISTEKVRKLNSNSIKLCKRLLKCCRILLNSRWVCSWAITLSLKDSWMKFNGWKNL